MLGDDINEGDIRFQPYTQSHKEGYYELEQIKPGIVICPHCGELIDARQSSQLKATLVVVQTVPGSWASVPICRCSGIWAIYDPNVGKWAFRYKIDNGDDSWQRA